MTSSVTGSVTRRADFPLLVYVMFAYKLTLTPQQMQTMMNGLPKC